MHLLSFCGTGLHRIIRNEQRRSDLEIIIHLLEGLSIEEEGFFFLEQNIKVYEILPLGIFQVFFFHSLVFLSFGQSTIACAVAAHGSSDPTSGVKSLI